MSWPSCWPASCRPRRSWPGRCSRWERVMTTQAADRELIDEVGRHVLAGHASSRRMTLVTKPRHFWPRLSARRPARDPQQGHPGARLVGAGLAAKAERALLVLCAAGSALMNYAAADITSPRSVLAFCMPPVFLAVVADRVAATIRRHVLGMQDGRSPWAVLGTAALYGLRLFLAFPSTCGGLRRWILVATPLPAAGEAPAPPAVVRQPRPAIARQARSTMSATKTEQLLALVA